MPNWKRNANRQQILNRPTASRQNNLISLETNMYKKKLAQDLFYGNQPNVGVAKRFKNRTPVHERLGNKKPLVFVSRVRQQTIQRSGGSVQKKKQSMQYQGSQNFRKQLMWSPQLQNFKRQLMQSPQIQNFRKQQLAFSPIQNRLKLIRQKQITPLKQQQKFNRSPSTKPVNYVIELKNSNKEIVKVPKHHNALSTVMQGYIKQIQAQSPPECYEFENFSVLPVPVNSTRVKLSDRFASY